MRLHPVDVSLRNYASCDTEDAFTLEFFGSG